MLGRRAAAWQNGAVSTPLTSAPATRGRVLHPRLQQTSPGGTTLDERIEAPLEQGDHERFSHYAEADKITEAMVLGTPIRALCGKIWVPSRDPSKFPICPECKEIYEDEERLAGWK